jgi:hypothetical protein
MANLLSNTTVGGYQSIHTGNIGSYALTSLPSHNHDDRYFTESESDSRYLRFTGAELTEGNYFYFRSNRGSYLGTLDSPSLQAFSTGGNSAFMSFHRGGYYAVNFGLDADNVMRIGGWSASSNRWQLDMSGNNTIAGNYYGGGAGLTGTASSLNVGSLGGYSLDTMKKYIWSRGENLLTNGTGLMGNNTNFGSFIFDGSQAYFSSGSFKYTGQYQAPNTDELMPMNPEKRYRLDFWAKTLNGQGAYYAYLNFFDVDGNAIYATNHMYYPNTLTTLAQTLNPGDTVVYLTSAANWENGGTAGVSTHIRSFIFWNYSNSFGYLYPPQTYSRNWYGGMWNPGAVNYSNNTITLISPWSGPSIAAGTQLSNGSAGGTFKYIALGYTIVPTTWTNYVGIMDGVDYSGSNAGGKFPPGTASAKLGFLTDYNASGDTIYLANLFVGVDNDYPIYDRWTGNTRIEKSGAFYGTMFYDSNNGSYYLDPSSTSNLYRVDAASQMRAPIFYDSQDTNYYLDPNGTSRLVTVNADTLRSYGNVYTDGNYGNGLVGLYSAERYQGVFAMGDSYKLAANGTTTGNLYGIAWTHTNVGGQSKSGLGHQALFMDNGNTQTAIGTGIWTAGLITTTSYGTSANWIAAYNWGNHASAGYLTGITSGQVTGALGYTPYNSSNPNGYITSSGNAATATLASTVTINYNNDSNSSYQLLWGSGNSVYGTANIYVNPSSDTIYATAYRGNANVAGTGEAIYAPAGVYSTGTNWLYGTMYLNGNTINEVSQIVLNGANTAPINITGAAHKYLTINPGNGYEAMVRYIGGSGSSWYVGKRVSSQLVGTESFHFYSEQAGATVAGIDTSGNIHASGSMRAPIFYDSQNTDYYGDFASESRLNTFTTAGSVVIGGTFANNAYNAVASTRLMFGGGNEPNGYFIGTNMENYGGNYTKLDLRWHTGIRMGAQPGYGGIRFFNNETLGSRIMSIGEGDANIRIDNNLWIGGAGGWITDLLNAKQNASTAITTSNIGSQSVSNANTVGGYTAVQLYTNNSSYLGGHYVSGGTELPNSATFGAGKLKLAMLSGGTLGFGGSWNDVLWLSAYSGGDVKSSHALVFDKYSTNVWVSDQNFDSGSWGTGYLLLSTANYNSYSPTLTGGGASGTWGINVTGNAEYIASNPNRTDGTAYPVVWSNGNSYSPNYSCAAVTIQSSTGTLRATNFISNQIVVSYANITDTTDGSTWYGLGNAGNLLGGGNTVQLAGWYGVRIKTSGANMDFYGSSVYYNATFNSAILQQAGNQVLHAGNYTAYSPSLTGSGASGTWGINVTGSAGSVAWTNVSSRPTALSQFTNDLGNYGGWITGINSGNVTTALGFTPYNATNPSGYITSSGSISGNAATATYATTAGSAPNGSNQNSAYLVTPGEGNGLKFWADDNYKISMGASSVYLYGTVTDYSIKTQMNAGDPGRGFTWGRIGVVPIASLNATSGNMQIAGTFTASNFSGSSSGTNTGDQTNISGNAATATNVAWTGVTGRPTALSQFSNDLGNYGGWLTTSGKAADSELFDGTDSIYFVKGNGVNTLGYRTTGNSGANSAGGLSSGFYDGSGMSNMPTSDWYHLIVNAHHNSSTSNQYEFHIATAFWNKSDFFVRSISPGDVGPWRTLIHNGNIGSQSVSYASTAGSASTATTATTATVASQLNKFGDIYGQNWNTYYVQDKLIAAAVYGHSGANRPNLTYDYGVALSYGEATGPLLQMYFPENSGNIGTIFRKGTYRTGWNGNWSTWKTLVEQEGNLCTIVGGNGTGLEVHGNVGYNQDPLTYFLLRGQADTSWKALKVRLTGDAGGQDIEFRRIAENGADSRMWYVPRGGNTVNFEYPIVQPSDSRLKDNITPISTPVEKIKALSGVEFDWNSGEQVGTHDVGLIAQDVEAVLPEAVTTQEDGYKNLAYTKVIPLLVEAMKEQQTMIEALRAEIELLKNK